MRSPTMRRAALMCVGLAIIVLGRVIDGVAGTAITVVGALATVYGMAFVMLYGFMALFAAVSMVVHLFRRRPPS